MSDAERSRRVQFLVFNDVTRWSFLNPLFLPPAPPYSSAQNEVTLCFNENVRSAADVMLAQNEFIRDMARSANIQMSEYDWRMFFASTDAIVSPTLSDGSGGMLSVDSGGGGGSSSR